jgi:hypothetical protein
MHADAEEVPHGERCTRQVKHLHPLRSRMRGGLSAFIRVHPRFPEKIPLTSLGAEVGNQPQRLRDIESALSN